MFNYFKTLSGCRTFSHFIAGTLATLTVCITILICCFAKITTLIFRAQASLHGQETSTDPCSYLTKMAHFNLKKKKMIFSHSSECSQGFSCSSLATTVPKCLHQGWKWAFKMKFRFVIWKHPLIIFSSSGFWSEFIKGTMTGAKYYLTELSHHEKAISIFTHYSILLNSSQSYSKGSWLGS